MGVLDGKVVLVTGGGAGIGRECALLAAREGAKVLVNDLGAGVSGKDEGSAGPAQAVVEEIRALGRTAIANSESVTSMASVQAMVRQAIDELGGLHAVINPAGILRDSMFHRMTDEDFDAVIAVHLRGAYNVARAAVEHFRNQGEGSFVLFTSTSGLIGNIGQSNYAAAKMGVVGLSRILALEGAAKGVRSNVVSPFAWTRMIATIPVTDESSAKRVERMRMGMRADQVAPLAVALASPGSRATGQIFAVRGNEVVLFSQPRPVKQMTRLEGWTPETLNAYAFPAMAPLYSPLEVSADIFPYDPV
jgi:NAD(P)-dependent dehydrogenase (short-subunit alcohol dehydrogenase family)